MKHYCDILAEVHNGNLDQPNEIYWEEMARVLAESYHILNQEFNQLYDCDEAHREYLLNLEPNVIRSIEILHPMTQTHGLSNSTRRALHHCIGEMAEFVTHVYIATNVV